MSEEFGQEYWDTRYGSTDGVWSGLANPVLMTETLALPAGRALDVGCGEGADAIWLASRGWQVTGVDFSGVALARAAERARQTSDDPASAHNSATGGTIADRLMWDQHDLTEWAPPAASFDLVTAQYMHLPSSARTGLFARLADAVAPGGTLLIVGHDVSEVHTTVHRMPDPDLFFTAPELAATLDTRRWRIEIAETRPRVTQDPVGTAVTVADAVLKASRR
ncbi:class I SAM-dependent methyltransferase [Cryobacterium soli]|uniref:class I SAM-dependent methyltransferase n=1 Tax=Cryobacterium soli TaxID=2220095 RepID=UPI000E7478A9|nr:class I SAM-dependent methyltransferase [Cryobacterium soli]